MSCASSVRSTRHGAGCEPFYAANVAGINYEHFHLAPSAASRSERLKSSGKGETLWNEKFCSELCPVLTLIPTIKVRGSFLTLGSLPVEDHFWPKIPQVGPN